MFSVRGRPHARVNIETSFYIIVFIIIMGGMLWLLSCARSHHVVVVPSVVISVPSVVVHVPSVEATHAATPTKRALSMVFMTQTERDTPEYFVFLRNEGFEVVVLAWKEDGGSGIQLSGVGQNLTWTEGRNALFSYVQQTKVHYDYYIFVDDDVTMTVSSTHPNTKQLAADPRVLPNEKWRIALAHMVLQLNTTLPAVWIPCFLYNTGACPANPEPFVRNVCHHDALFVAVHHTAAPYLLPYDTAFDAWSWWSSQAVFNIRTCVFFRGFLVKSMLVTASNPKHRDYIRRTPYTNDVYSRTRAFLPDAWKKCIPVPTPAQPTIASYLEIGGPITPSRLLFSDYARPLRAMEQVEPPSACPKLDDVLTIDPDVCPTVSKPSLSCYTTRPPLCVWNDQTTPDNYCVTPTSIK